MFTTRKPTHPGLILKEDVINPLGLTITEAAENLGISRKHLSQLINGHISLTPEMAVRISKATKTSAESWLNMQIRLDLWYANQKECKVIPFPEIKEFQENLS